MDKVEAYVREMISECKTGEILLDTYISSHLNEITYERLEPAPGIKSYVEWRTRLYNFFLKQKNDNKRKKNLAMLSKLDGLVKNFIKVRGHGRDQV